MPRSEQGVNRERYMLIPRTAIFVRRGDEYLLIRGAPTKRLWAGKYNGLGGHVEKGEDVLSAARRELYEEAGLSADLWLCGIVVVDAGDPGAGICLFVFCGQNPRGGILPSKEGTIEWIRRDALGGLPVVADLPILIERIHSMKRGEPPFMAGSSYDDSGKLTLRFAE